MGGGDFFLGSFASFWMGDSISCPSVYTHSDARDAAAPPASTALPVVPAFLLKGTAAFEKARLGAAPASDARDPEARRRAWLWRSTREGRAPGASMLRLLMPCCCFCVRSCDGMRFSAEAEEVRELRSVMQGCPRHRIYRNGLRYLVDEEARTHRFCGQANTVAMVTAVARGSPAIGTIKRVAVIGAGARCALMAPTGGTLDKAERDPPSQWTDGHQGALTPRL